MSQYEKEVGLITDSEQLLSGKAQIHYINEMEDLCKTCDRVIVSSEIARTAFSHRKYFEKFAERRGFTIQFGIMQNAFVMERIADSRLNITVEQILKNHKEEVCQKEAANKLGMSKLRNL